MCQQTEEWAVADLSNQDKQVASYDGCLLSSVTSIPCYSDFINCNGCRWPEGVIIPHHTCSHTMPVDYISSSSYMKLLVVVLLAGVVLGTAAAGNSSQACRYAQTEPALPIGDASYWLEVQQKLADEVRRADAQQVGQLAALVYMCPVQHCA